MRPRLPLPCLFIALAAASGALAQTAPMITLQPVSAAVFVGDPLTLIAAADGDAPITFQWHKNLAPIAGATSPVLSIATLALTDTGNYHVVATNAAGAAASQPAAIFVAKRTQTVAFNPTVTTAIAGSSIALSATASSGLPVAFTLVSGSASLAGGFLTGDGGTVVVRATQPGNEFYSAADGVERTFSFALGGLAPFLTSPPVNQAVTAGATATFRAAAIGTPAPTLQWQRDGADIAGATGGSLVIANTTLADTGRYSVVATNSRGSVSASATLTVQTAPLITAQPAGAEAFAGDSVTFSVAVTAVPAATYQWRRNGTNLPGATQASFAIASVAAANAGRYDVVVTNTLGAATSAGATLTVTVRDFSGVYLGEFAGGAGRFGVAMRADRTGVLVAHLPAAGTGLAVLNLQADLAGRFSVNTTTVGTAPRAATVRGAFNSANATVAGDVTGLGLAFEAARAPRTGAAAGSAGWFFHAVAGSAAHRGISVIAADGQAFFLQLNNTAVDSARGALTAAGRLTTATAAQGALDLGYAGGLSTGTLRTGGATVQFSGAIDSLVGATRLINLSVRALTAPGATNLITGFVIGGTAAKQVMVRAVGPSLTGAPFNLTGVLADPTLQLVRGTATVGQNDNWGTPAANTAALNAAATRAGAFPLRAGSADAALVSTIPASPYSVAVGGGTGTVLAEVYEVLEQNEAPGARKLINLSARGVVSPVAPFIAGFVIGGSAPQRVLIRAVGPTLGAAPFNLAGALPNPVLTLFRGAAAVKTNDDWFRDADAVLIRDAALRAGAFPLGATATDAAMVLYLAPGAYTAQIDVPPDAPAAAQTGLALIEIYDAAL